ncbi:XRE family transcriptional regulator [Methylobacterium sp. 37f]|uniref:XRE family transcriptional regulator n=1 Tax=Methylobacterium sp. 37f TaxID=2817058 RepID=UPI001FFCF47C|nr:XRE family transcriptional regulator [Methylobacterium sp. 37f]MCK2053329.1 ImmA/IrrE family metallo-endopeptidase [Methylobacterium sp. 37f]
MNERELQRARKELARLDAARGNSFLLNLLEDGIAPEVIELQREGIDSAIARLKTDIENFEIIKKQHSFNYKNLSSFDIGKLPIIARIVSGFSQKDLADKLGVKEQQIQRYEAESYSSIKLGTFIGLLEKLNIEISASGSSTSNTESDTDNDFALDKKFSNHIRKHNWFGNRTNDLSDAEIEKLTKDLVVTSSKAYSSKALFKSGKNRLENTRTFEEKIWISEVINRALCQRAQLSCKFDFLRLDYISELLSLSTVSNGPVQAVDKLLDLGLIVIILAGFPGMAIDGVALLVEDTPVIALTIRHDRIDSFWFTLLHEIGHIHLHHSKGLDAGFFDDFDTISDSPLEHEANTFAGELIISSEKWRTSPARLSKSAESVSKLAKNLMIHEALLFGKIRKERGYNLFSDKVGQGKIRSLFFGNQ